LRKKNIDFKIKIPEIILRKSFLIFLFAAVRPSLLSAQENKLSSDTAIVKLVFAGDVMGHMPVIESAFDSDSNTYNFDTTFYFLKPFLQSADLAIANLETTLSGPPYSGYPHFCSPDAYASSLKRAGFGIVVMANNHAADKGGNGINRTLNMVDSSGLLHTGTFRSKQERDSLCPLIAERNGIRIALLNYSYGTNGEAVPFPYIVNIIDTAIIMADIDKARSRNADFVICIMHWGNEYERNASSEQKKLARWIFIHGCDMIIGSHPHVVQPLEIIVPDSGDIAAPKLVLYSLGNLVSNQRERYKNGGILFGVKLMKCHKTWLDQYEYLPVWVNKTSEGSQPGFYLITPQAWNAYKDDFQYSITTEKTLNEFFEDTRAHMKEVKEMSGPDW
jgi:poly-gamma-glutamate capsule biosynthesis protein CapA/YwtB (metallophosphatase superfamily)